jgi:hypothetical protein
MDAVDMRLAELTAALIAADMPAGHVVTLAEHAAMQVVLLEAPLQRPVADSVAAHAVDLAAEAVMPVAALVAATAVAAAMAAADTANF